MSKIRVRGKITADKYSAINIDDTEVELDVTVEDIREAIQEGFTGRYGDFDDNIATEEVLKLLNPETEKEEKSCLKEAECINCIEEQNGFCNVFRRDIYKHLIDCTHFKPKEKPTKDSANNAQTIA